MLCLVVQLDKCEIIPKSETNYNVMESKAKCKKSKNNIVAKTTGHHHSCGCIYGFGSHWEFRNDELTHSSVGLYKTHKGFKHFGTILQN